MNQLIKILVKSGNSTTQSQQPIRPSSTLLGFSSTPNYVPISAFGAPSANYSGDSQLITINLIRKPDGFGFRLLGGQEVSCGTFAYNHENVILNAKFSYF